MCIHSVDHPAFKYKHPKCNSRNNRYKQIIDPEIPNCGFIGLSPSYNWLQTSYKQANWFLNYCNNNNNNLSKNNMYKEIELFNNYQKKNKLDYEDLTYELFNYLEFI